MKPILFNTEMVRAILDGRKSCTRRLLKIPRYVELEEDGTYTLYADGTAYAKQSMEEITDYLKSPYQVGDILYVRETWKCWRAHRFEANADISYRAGGQDTRLEFAYGNTDSTNRDGFDSFVSKWFNGEKWHPSIHMPKEASRIFLKVNDVRVERLQDITEEQAEKEGASPMTTPNIQGVGRTYIQGFGELWNSTVDKNKMQQYGWNANPYVWVIEFERCEKPEVTHEN